MELARSIGPRCNGSPSHTLRIQRRTARPLSQLNSAAEAVSGVAVQQPRNRMTLWSRVARADRQAGEEQRNARAGVLLSKLVKGSGTKPGRDLMPLFMGVYCLGGTQGDDAPHGGRWSISHCDLLSRGKARIGRSLTEHMPLRPPLTGRAPPGPSRPTRSEKIPNSNFKLKNPNQKIKNKKSTVLRAIAWLSLYGFLDRLRRITRPAHHARKRL